MRGRTSNNRLSSSSSRLAFGIRVSLLMLSMFATMASVLVAGRLWLEAENRVNIIEELDKSTGQGRYAISVDSTLKIIACREQQKKLSELKMELDKATQEGFVSKHLSENNEARREKAFSCDRDYYCIWP